MTKAIGTKELIDVWAESGAVSTPDISKVNSGWQSGERPAFQYMNYLQNLFGKQINYLARSGIPEWSDETPYVAGNAVIISGVAYIAAADNTDDAPPSANWTLLGGMSNKLDATAAPTVDDDAGEGYAIGSRWIDVTNDEAYILLDATVGAAVWQTTTLTIDDLGSAALLDSVDEDDFASNSASLLPTQQSVKAFIETGYRLKSFQVFTADGTYTKSTGTRAVYVIPHGGGGGGAGANTGARAGGGSSGGWAEKFITSGIGATDAVTVGDGGGGGAIGGGGAAGGSSSFGAHCSATGGGAGSSNGATGQPGAGSGGDRNYRGNPGQVVYTGSANGGGGSGGSGKFGGGGWGVLGAGPAGFSGTGSGGAGGINNTTGGAGANGFVLIMEYI